MVASLTDQEKSMFDGLLQGALHERLTLARMTLDDEEVAVVTLQVMNRFTDKLEGLMPLAILIDDDVVQRLREPSGAGPASVSPNDVK